MFSEALPIYSGGLGNVAGDQLKAASDLGVPVVGVGLLYQRGYFRQVIDEAGSQQALFPFNDPGQLPITPLREANGEWLRLKIELAGLLGLVARLAGPGRPGEALSARQQRRRELPRASRDYQRAVWRRARVTPQAGSCFWGSADGDCLLQLGIQPEVCHLNEGHAAFAVLERARSFMEESGQPSRSLWP